MPTNNQLLTFGEVFEIPPGDRDNPAWVNGEFEAMISNIVPKTSPNTGRSYWKALLTDPDSPDMRLEVTFFTNPMKFSNRICRFSGGGMKRTEYNGTQQLELGKNTMVNAVTNAQTPPPAAAQQQRRGAPPARGNMQGDRPPARQPAQSVPKKPVLDGQSIGMAIKLAGDFMISSGLALDPTTLWEGASDILRVSERLRGGNLAPLYSERKVPVDPLHDVNDLGATDEGVQHDPPEDVNQEHQEQPSPASRSPEPGPELSAFPTNQDIYEDVPF